MASSGVAVRYCEMKWISTETLRDASEFATLTLQALLPVFGGKPSQL